MLPLLQHADSSENRDAPGVHENRARVHEDDHGDENRRDDNRDTVRNLDPDVHAYINALAHGHAERNSDTDRHGDSDGDRYIDPDSDAFGDAVVNALCYSFGNSDADGHGDSDTHAD